MSKIRHWVDQIVGERFDLSTLGSYLKGRWPQLPQALAEKVDLAEIDHLTDEDWAVMDAELSSLLDQRNDRGVAVTFHAMVDDRLRWAIEKCFIDNLSNTDKAELFEGTSPLATYSARVRLAYAMGLINKAGRGEFLLLGRIRNKFAHEFKRVRFSDPPISKLCQNLDIPRGLKDHFGDDQMMRYTFCCFTANITLLASAQIKILERKYLGVLPPT